MPLDLPGHEVPHRPTFLPLRENVAAFQHVAGVPGHRRAAVHQGERVAELGAASLSYSDLTTGWDDRRAAFLALTDEVWRVRAYGDFWSYCMVAEGSVDIACEPEVKVWDIAPLDILIREAGGTFTGIDGTPGPHSGSALATNGLLHDQVLSRLV